MKFSVWGRFRKLHRTGRGKLKTQTLASVLLVLAVSIGAQEADSVNSTEQGSSRPAETEILLNQDDSAAAENTDQAPVENGAPLPGVGFSDFLRMVLVLALVIGLIYAFVWFLKKFTSQKAESEDIINLLSTRPLKGDAALHLVEVGTSVFLVGSCSHSVNLISEIDDDDSKNEIKLAASMAPTQPVSGGFARMFRDRFGTGQNTDANNTDTKGSGSPEDPTPFLKLQKEKLKDL